MSIERVYGPIRGAGTQITEVVGQRNLIQGRLGTTVFIGVFERGDEDDINMLPGPNSLLRRLGGLLDDADFNVPSFASLDAPQCSKDFWEHSGGAGSLICLRVVPKTNNATNDDRPTKAQMPVYTRGLLPARIGYIEAKSGGYWAGKRNVYLSKISGTPGTDFPTADQIKLDGIAAKTLKRDQWFGAVVVLDGITTRTYKVVENTSDGTLTLEADSDVISDWGAGETYGQDRSAIGPFNLETVATQDLDIDSDLGGPTAVTLTYAPAGVVPGAVPTLPIAGGATAQIIVNGVTYTANVGGAATVQDLIDALNAIPGINSVEDPAGEITTLTDIQGTSATFALGTLSGVTAADIWGAGYALTATGTGDVVNHLAATAAEVATALIVTAGAICTATAQADGSFILRTDTSGVAGWGRTPSGGMRTLLGFDTTQHYGTDGPSDLDVIMYMDNTITRGDVKDASIIFKDGGLRPSTEFGLEFRIDGIVYLNYKNLSMEPGKSNYWVDVINNDPNNNHITIVDQFGGDRAEP